MTKTKRIDIVEVYHIAKSSEVYCPHCGNPLTLWDHITETTPLRTVEFQYRCFECNTLSELRSFKIK